MTDPTLSFSTAPASTATASRRHLARGLEGADDGELFLEYRQSEMLVFDNGRLKQATYDTDQGFGLRAVKDEAVGYAHASDLSEAALGARRRRGAGGQGRLFRPAMRRRPARTNVRLYGDDNPLGAPVLRDQGDAAGDDRRLCCAPRTRACAR